MIDFTQTTKFLDTIFLELLRSWIDISYFELDHICYRVETYSEYQEKKQELFELWELLSETEISGRLISTFKLNKPIK